MDVQAIKRKRYVYLFASAISFLVLVNHAGKFRGQEIGDPLQTITAKHG